MKNDCAVASLVVHDVAFDVHALLDMIDEVLTALVVASKDFPARVEIILAHSQDFGAQGFLKRLPDPKLTIEASCRLISLATVFH